MGEAGGRGVQGESSLAPAQAWGLFLLAAGPRGASKVSLDSWPPVESQLVPPAVVSQWCKGGRGRHATAIFETLGSRPSSAPQGPGGLGQVPSPLSLSPHGHSGIKMTNMT